MSEFASNISIFMDQFSTIITVVVGLSMAYFIIKAALTQSILYYAKAIAAGMLIIIFLLIDILRSVS